MSYSERDCWDDMNKVLYSPYYGALSGKQHGTGIMTAKNFLSDKIALAEQMFEMLGGKDPAILRLLLTADSLSASPYGFGGKDVLQGAYNFDQNQTTLKIAKELQLSDIIIESLDRSPTAKKSLETTIVESLGEPLANVDIITPEIKQEYLQHVANRKMPRDFIERLKNQPVSQEQASRIAMQESHMRHAISKLNEQQRKNPLKYLLGTKEMDFAQQKPQPDQGNV